MFKKIVKNSFIALILTLIVSNSAPAFAAISSSEADFSLPPKCISDAYYQLKPQYQKISGPCYGFSSIAAVEARLVKNNSFYGCLSQKHLLTWFNQDPSEAGWHRNIYLGGNFFQTAEYFVSGQGPIYESDMPYNTKNTVYDKTIHNIKPCYSINGIEFILGNQTNKIKQAIMEYGGVAAALDMQTAFPEIGFEAPHGICILGWDDDEESWIIKDSGGFVDGFGYMSIPLIFGVAWQLPIYKITMKTRISINTISITLHLWTMNLTISQSQMFLNFPVMKV